MMFISLSSQSGNFWIHPTMVHFISSTGTGRPVLLLRHQLEQRYTWLKFLCVYFSLTVNEENGDIFWITMSGLQLDNLNEEHENKLMSESTKKYQNKSL